MKKKLGVLFFVLMCGFPLTAVGQSPEQQKDVKRLPTCLDFTEVYDKAVLGTAAATKEDEQLMQSLASIMTGYVSALQDIYGGRLIGMSEQDNEWTLLEKVAQFCRQFPHLTFQSGVRSVPAVSDTVQALQDEEFKRCQNYIEQTKKTICSSLGNK